jgi:hypothetical protein
MVLTLKAPSPVLSRKTGRLRGPLNLLRRRRLRQRESGSSLPRRPVDRLSRGAVLADRRVRSIRQGRHVRLVGLVPRTAIFPGAPGIRLASTNDSGMQAMCVDLFSSLRGASKLLRPSRPGAGSIRRRTVDVARIIAMTNWNSGDQIARLTGEAVRSRPLQGRSGTPKRSSAWPKRVILTI